MPAFGAGQSESWRGICNLLQNPFDHFRFTLAVSQNSNKKCIHRVCKGSRILSVRRVANWVPWLREERLIKYHGDIFFLQKWYNLLFQSFRISKCYWPSTLFLSPRLLMKAVVSPMIVTIDRFPLSIPGGLCLLPALCSSRLARPSFLEYFFM